MAILRLKPHSSYDLYTESLRNIPLVLRRVSVLYTHQLHAGRDYMLLQAALNS